MSAFQIRRRGLQRLARSALIALVVLYAAACGGQPPEADPGDAAARRPAWLERVYPAPGSEASAASVIQVRHGLPGARGNLRLLVDGVDVTAYSDVEPGELTFDPKDERVAEVIELTPGTHTATVRRAALPQEGEQLDVLDTYEWTFTIF